MVMNKQVGGDMDKIIFKKVKSEIRKVRFMNGIKNKRVKKFNILDNKILYVLCEEEKFLAIKEYCINPMIEIEGILRFTDKNLQYIRKNVFNRKEREYVNHVLYLLDQVDRSEKHGDK